MKDFYLFYELDKEPNHFFCNWFADANQQDAQNDGQVDQNADDGGILWQGVQVINNR